MDPKKEENETQPVYIIVEEMDPMLQLNIELYGLEEGRRRYEEEEAEYLKRKEKEDKIMYISAAIVAGIFVLFLIYASIETS